MMRRSPWTRALALAVIVLVAGCGDEQNENTAGAETTAAVTDIARSAPQNAKVILENDFVRVAEFALSPGDSLPTHFGRNRAVYTLTDFKARFAADGTDQVIDNAKGTVHWHPAQKHSLANIGDTEALFVVVERKGSRLLEAPIKGEEQEITHIAPEHSRVLFENEFVRVAEFDIAPGEILPSHKGTSRIMYTLTPARLKFQSDRFGEHEDDFQQGEAHWHDLDTHSVANAGENQVVFIVFEWKK